MNLKNELENLKTMIMTECNNENNNGLVNVQKEIDNLKKLITIACEANNEKIKKIRESVKIPNEYLKLSLTKDSQLELVNYSPINEKEILLKHKFEIEIKPHMFTTNAYYEESKDFDGIVIENNNQIEIVSKFMSFGYSGDVLNQLNILFGNLFNINDILSVYEEMVKEKKQNFNVLKEMVFTINQSISNEKKTYPLFVFESSILSDKLKSGYITLSAFTKHFDKVKDKLPILIHRAKDNGFEASDWYEKCSYGDIIIIVETSLDKIVGCYIENGHKDSFLFSVWHDIKKYDLRDMVDFRFQLSSYGSVYIKQHAVPDFEIHGQYIKSELWMYHKEHSPYDLIDKGGERIKNYEVIIFQ